MRKQHCEHQGQRGRMTCSRSQSRDLPEAHGRDHNEASISLQPRENKMISEPAVWSQKINMLIILASYIQTFVLNTLYKSPGSIPGSSEFWTISTKNCLGKTCWKLNSIASYYQFLLIPLNNPWKIPTMVNSLWSYNGFIKNNPVENIQLQLKAIYFI